MPKLAWIIAGFLTCLLAIVFLGFTSWQKHREVVETHAELARTRAQIADATAAAQALETRLAAAQARIETLQSEKAAVTRSQQSLEQDLRTALESKDVTISQLQGKLTVSILDRILFDSGEAVLKPDGEVVLRQVAAVLAQHTNLTIHVIGHTDNVPIRASPQGRFASNWELSTARANAAVRFLTEQERVDPRRVGAVGYGEFRPIADNATAEGRAQNRRIAITVLSEELAGSDAAPTAAPALPALLPPLPLPATNAPVAPLPLLPATDTNAPAPTNAPPMLPATDTPVPSDASGASNAAPSALRSVRPQSVVAPPRPSASVAP